MVETPTSFPSVTAKETNVASPLVRKEWRTANGIVGKFRKGPPLARVRSSEDLAKFFGDDNKMAPVTINQAMDNGVEEFVVSRAIASDTPAEITARLTTAGTPRESYVDDSGDEATQGITVLAEYLSEVAKTTPVTSDISATRKHFNSDNDGSAAFGNSSFKTYLEGQATVNFRAEMFVNGGGPTETELIDSLKVYNPDVNGSKLLSSTNTGHISSGDDIVLIAELSSMSGVSSSELANKVKDVIFPGVNLELTASDAQLTGGLPIELMGTVVSTPEDYLSPDANGTAWRFAVRVTVNANNPDFGTSNWIDLIDNSTPTPGDLSYPTNDYYVLSYSINPLVEDSWPEVSDSPEYGEYVTGMFPSYLHDSRVDGFITVNQSEGIYPVEIWSFFTENDRQQPIQTGLTKPLNMLDLNIDSVDGVSGDATGMTPSHLKLLDENGNVYDRLNKIVDIPSEFAVRIDQGMAYVGRPFTDTGNNIDALELGKDYVDVINELFTQLSETTSTQDIFSDLQLSTTYDRNNTQTYQDIKLTTRAAGKTANNMKVRVALTGGSTQPDDIIGSNFSQVGSTNNVAKTLKKGDESFFKKGRIGPKRASRVLYTRNGDPLIEVRALGPGKTDLEVSVKVRRNGRFDLIVVDRDAEEYYDAPIVERLSLTNDGVVRGQRSSIYPATRQSKLIRAFYLPKRYGLSKANQEKLQSEMPARSGANLGTFVPAANTFNQSMDVPETSTVAVGSDFLDDVKLTGGTEGDAQNQPSAEDYVEATKRLESYNVVQIANPDITFNGSVNAPAVRELIDQADRSDTFNGIRHAVFQLPRKLPISRVKSIVPNLLNNNRVRLVAGYMTYDKRPELGYNRVPQLGTYLGWVVSRPPHLSPAAMSPQEVINGAVTTDIPTEKAYLSALSENNIDGMYFDQSIRRLRFLNGQTTSTAIEGQYVAVSDLFDEVMMQLSNRLSFVRSQPLSEDLMKRARSMVDTYLEYLTNRGWIAGYAPTIADERNNPPEEQRRGMLHLRINIDPLIPADHIEMNFLRQQSRTLSLQTQT